MSQIPINYNLQLQSPFLYCNAAGSDTSDGTEGGVHLRWDLMKELGENHLPKGNLAGTNAGFNKNEDFVSLYRIPYVEQGRISLEVDAYQSGDNFEYLPNNEGITITVPSSPNPLIINVKLLNRAKFRAIVDAGLAQDDPLQDFLNKYDDVIEIEVPDRLMFGFGALCGEGGNGGDGIFETVSTPDRSDASKQFIIKRELKTSADLSNDGLNIRGENIRSIRLRQTSIPRPYVIMIDTYEEFFEASQEMKNWHKIGDFSLSLDDNEVLTWFQASPYGGGVPTLPWPKYNDGAQLLGDNYLDRWHHGNGLKNNVSQFIMLSDNDPRAYVNYASADPGDENTVSVSMLDMLKLVTLDYHGARMLGLGYIDTYPLHERLSYVYAAVYVTVASLPGVPQENDHVFLTLPTSIADYRLPVAPELQLTYGLYVSTDEDSPPELLSDASGYSFYSDERFINLHRQLVSGPEPKQLAIPDGPYFDATIITQPFSFGLEYKLNTEGQWRSPEILHDDEYADINGVAEPITTPEKDSSPLYTHIETATGIHEYALYSVNWFSRTSGISNVAQTTNTQFPKRNTLLPPFNLAVQYIQEEDPLIFTSQAEQNELAALNNSNPNGDNYKTRVTFDWDNLHQNAYQSANKVEFFFRANPLKKVDGKIQAVTSISETECVVTTTSFQMTSTNPPVTVSPSIPAGEQSKFIGSLLCTPEGQYQIVSVTPGATPSFTIKKNRSNETVQPNQTDPVSVVAVYTTPVAGDIFFVFENVENTAEWTKLNRTVSIVTFSTQTELIHEDDGSSHVEIVGGINGVANIQEIAGSDGGYDVIFSSTNLPAHPEAGVSWAKGSARFVMANFPLKKKRLAVYAIRQTNPIHLVVYDPEYLLDSSQRIQTGNQTVNFHPGYKLYLSAETNFGKPQIMPTGSQNNKKTYIAARSLDTSFNLHSSLTQPAILVARNIQKPLAPEAVVGPAFATRPDVYEKSTYTIDISLNVQGRVPYGVVVYRATEMAVLQALYAPQTVNTIVQQLASIAANDPLRYNRWRSLIEAEADPADANEFKMFGSYRFPRPDNTSTTVFVDAEDEVNPFPLSGTVLSNKAIIKRAIEDVFIPLTEVPVVFEYLKTGYQTSPSLPRIRDMVGRLLSPADPLFDPFPMAVKFPASNPDKVRFTDYTLEGSARNIYFYFAREVAVDTKLSERTAVSGPVVLIDSSPAEKPVIRKVITKEADPLQNVPASIAFDVAEYIDSENIAQYQIFRTTDIGKAATTRTMQLASTVNVGDEVVDDFSDLSFPPYGEPLYYRIVALRQIVNEQSQPEMVPSKPSEMMLTNVIDVLNPEAPEILPTILNVVTDGNGNVIAYLNVTLEWSQTVYNGTYHLYKKNDKGNWEKIWTKKSNAAQITFPENGDFVTWPQTANLAKMDGDGNVIYHYFKVSVENGSGLLNLEDDILEI